MKSKACIMTIDAGTTSIKVSLFTQKLELLACSVQEYQLKTFADRVEASAGIYMDAVCAGAYAVLRAVPQSEIAAIGVTTQGETLALFSESGVPLTPFIVWLDSRAGDCAERLNSALGDNFYEETGLPEINGALPLAKVMWLRENEPELYEKAAKIMLLEDYLLYWFTGKCVTEKSIQTSTGWFNLNTDEYWDKALTAAEIDKNLLPELRESGTLIAPLTGTAARLLNLTAGIPVVAGAMDQTAAALSAGCIKEGIVCETTGTALVMAACTDKPVFNNEHRVTIYRHAMPGLFIYLPIGNTAGMALKWFRDEMCAELENEGYTAMDKLAQEADEGCGGLVFLPFLAGSVDPDACAEAKGVFYGATLATKKADFVRSIFESVGFMLKDFIEMLRRLGVNPDRILSLGGGSRSPLWQQIKSDICALPFYSAHCSEAASQGAALLAMWGAGLLPQGEAPRKDNVLCYEPCDKFIKSYQKTYRLYKSLYSAIKPIYLGDDKNEQA